MESVAAVVHGIEPVGAARAAGSGGPLLATLAEGEAADCAREALLRDCARQLMREAATKEPNPVVFNKEQEDVIALIAGKLEEVLAAKDAVARGEAPRPVSQLVLLLHGLGGTGKTEVVSLIRRVINNFFGEGGDVAAAQSNSAARGIGGQTIHSAFEVPSRNSLQLHALGSGPKESLIDALREVVAVIFEEVSMIEAALLGAASYKMCCARQRWHGCHPF